MYPGGREGTEELPEEAERIIFDQGVLRATCAPASEGLRLAEMAYLSEGQIPEEVGHGAVL